LALGWATGARAKPAVPHAAVKTMTVAHTTTGAHRSTTAHAAGHKIA
jgi:hypothetical protein